MLGFVNMKSELSKHARWRTLSVGAVCVQKYLSCRGTVCWTPDCKGSRPLLSPSIQTATRRAPRPHCTGTGSHRDWRTTRSPVARHTCSSRSNPWRDRRLARPEPTRSPNNASVTENKPHAAGRPGAHSWRVMHRPTGVCGCTRHCSPAHAMAARRISVLARQATACSATRGARAFHAKPGLTASASVIVTRPGASGKEDVRGGRASSARAWRAHARVAVRGPAAAAQCKEQLHAALFRLSRRSGARLCAVAHPSLHSRPLRGAARSSTDRTGHSQTL